MPDFIPSPGLAGGLSRGQLDFSGGGDLALILFFTNTAHDPSWVNLLQTGFANAIIPVTFPDIGFQPANLGYNIGGDQKEDVVFNDKTLVATGGPTGPFQNVYVVDYNTFRILGRYDYGQPVTINDTQAFVMELHDSFNRMFSITV